MKRYILHYDLYRNDEWQDLETEIEAETETKAIQELLRITNNLAKNITIWKN
jgi:hypothetical protein